MLKNILKLDGAQVLSKNEKKSINGGMTCGNRYIAWGDEYDPSCITKINGYTVSGVIVNGKCCVL